MVASTGILIGTQRTSKIHQKPGIIFVGKGIGVITPQSWTLMSLGYQVQSQDMDINRKIGSLFYPKLKLVCLGMGSIDEGP
jgi:hypothetical protein